MKKIVFTFGRFNPPTTGHLLLATKVKEEARRRGADYKIYGSNTKDAKRNPLSAVDKSRFMKKVLKDTNIIVNNKSGNPFTVLQQLSKEGYTDITMVVGADRVAEFKNGMKKYIGKKGYENIANFDVISAGERDPDAEGIEGMSASKMRAAAAEGNFNAFKLGIPSHVSEADRLKLFKAVRKGMGVRGKIQETWFDYDEFVEFTESFELKESVQLDEISVQARRKMARAAKRTAKIRARKRKLKERRRKGKKELVKKANKAAIAKVRAKLIRGMKWADVPFLQREKIDAKIKKKKKRIASIAKKMMPAMQKAEKERLAKVRAKMTTNDPAKAIESVDLDFENTFLMEDKQLRARIKANDEANRRKKKAEEKETSKEEYGKEVIATRTADGKILIMTAGDAKAGENSDTHKITNKKPNKGAMNAASKDDNFECTTTSKNLGVPCPRGKDPKETTAPETAPETAPKTKTVHDELSDADAKLALDNIKNTPTDEEAFEAEQEEQQKAILAQEVEKIRKTLDNKPLKGNAKYHTDFKAEDFEAGIVDHVNLIMENGYDGGISAKDRDKINKSVMMSQSQAERYGIEEGSAAKRAVESPGGLKDFMDANSKGELGDENETYKWKAIHAGKNIAGEGQQGLSGVWKGHAPRSGPTSKSDIVLVREDSKGKEKRYGISVKAGKSRLISSAPLEAVAFFEMAKEQMGDKLDNATILKINELTKTLKDRNQTHVNTGMGMGPLGWFTTGGKYKCRGCSEKKGPKWWDIVGPGSANPPVPWGTVFNQEPKAEHWKGTKIAKYNKNVVKQIQDGKEFHEGLAKDVGEIFATSPEFKRIVFREAATGCCKFCGCCSQQCTCECGTSKVASHMMTMSADGSNVSMSSLEKDEQGNETINKIIKKSDVAFSFKSTQKETSKIKKGDKGKKLGDYTGYAALQVHTDESVLSSFADRQKMLMEANISEEDAIQMYKQDVDLGKDIGRQNKQELNSVKGNPFKLVDYLGLELEDMESSEIEDWSDIGLELESKEETEIQIGGEKGKKKHRIPVLNFKKQSDEEEEWEDQGLALSPEEENILFNEEFELFIEKAPEGWEGTVKAMKKDKSIDNPFALAHWMKEKGYKSRKPVTDSYEFKDSSTHGLGSFATRDIKEGEEISLYYLNLFEDIPSYQRTDFCRLTNHSHINENVSLLKNDENFYAHATKNIKEGEELFIDYFSVFENILPELGENGKVINEVLLWTEGYGNLNFGEEPFIDLRYELKYFVEQGDCPNFVMSSQFYEDYLKILPDYPNQREIYDEDLFDSKLGKPEWELGDPTIPITYDQITYQHIDAKAKNEGAGDASAAGNPKRAAYLKTYNAQPEQRANRSKRTLARRELINQGRVEVGDGKDVHHKNGNPSDNSPSNLKVTSAKTNRGLDNNKWRKNNEEHGAGDIGTKELLKKYLKDTPYMTINDKFSKEL